MADISGRRDRNKKSPGVHYDMHRCTRGCDLHCFVAERNVNIGKCDYMGTGESVSTACVCVRVCLYIYIYIFIYVFRIISNDGRSRVALISWNIDIIEKRFWSRIVFGIFQKVNIDQHFAFSHANDNKVYLLLYIKNKKEENNVINFYDLHIFLYKTCHCFSLLM